MRKIVLSGIAALALFAAAPAAFSHMSQLAAEGSGADVRMTRHTMVAMKDGNTRPVLVAIMLFAPSDSGTG